MRSRTCTGQRARCPSSSKRMVRCCAVLSQLLARYEHVACVQQCFAGCLSCKRNVVALLVAVGLMLQGYPASQLLTARLLPGCLQDSLSSAVLQVSSCVCCRCSAACSTCAAALSCKSVTKHAAVALLLAGVTPQCCPASQSNKCADAWLPHCLAVCLQDSCRSARSSLALAMMRKWGAARAQHTWRSYCPHTTLLLISFGMRAQASRLAASTRSSQPRVRLVTICSSDVLGDLAKPQCGMGAMHSCLCIVLA